MPEGEYRVKLTALSGVKTSAAPTLKYESQAMDILEMSQFYMHCMREAFTIAINNGAKVSDLDEAMRKAFDTPSGIPVRAFELIFGFLDKSLIDTSIFDAPTLLHLAAEFGLNEFADRLLKLPSAAMVNNMSNGQSRYPCDIARVCKYTHGGHLADMLSAARELDEEFQNYISMVNYYNLNTEGAEEYEPIPTLSLIKNKTFPGYVPMQSRGVSMRPNHGSVRGREDRDPSLYNYVDRSALPDPFAELSDQAAAKPESRLPLDLGAQIELIEYMEGFKTGEYSLNDAVILFEEWKRRQMQSGGSLKEKREELNKLKNDIHSVTNGADINISRPNDPSIPLTPTTPTSPPLTAPKPQKKPSFFNRFLFTKKKPSTKQSSAANSPEADVSQQQPLARVMEETPPAHRYSSSSNGSRTSNLSRSSNSSGFQDEVDEVPGKRQSFRMEAFRSLELSLPPPALPPRLSHRPRPPVRNESRDTRHR
ncbi:hypothetical protein CAPTEDRAFT_223685 [Capitella teleta]|uniref:DBB domain-containing protein n=1 Tax=Capitella teleta TaxID=283909 RepID=R7UKU0_CAPTE|nr:hypothetical protein CAPTEDRAFT_223685 [Capitella teleta]|eukprot:ELU04403.1 hypothetical protein CAPTEDRAFT_223685 [Capitella teleta]